ncbi:hypothetical protein [Enterococcus sp.]|uniref:hypothetical protein n=1 Tax=Enterococcus sp. TaxID=35783 RepID=UPI002899C56C|nr:hypothetical protein [Enterococcus sp.]
MVSNLSVYDIRPDVVSKLQEITEIQAVRAAFPEEWNKLPCVVYTCESKPAQKNKSSIEYLTNWKIQIELFSNKSGMADLAKEVQKSVSELGFFDIQVKDANIRGLQRKLINASGVVDNRTLLVTKN